MRRLIATCLILLGVALMAAPPAGAHVQQPYTIYHDAPGEMSCALDSGFGQYGSGFASQKTMTPWCSSYSGVKVVTVGYGGQVHEKWCFWITTTPSTPGCSLSYGPQGVSLIASAPGTAIGYWNQLCDHIPTRPDAPYCVINKHGIYGGTHNGA